jgi:signal transduction histidine kinase
MNELCDINLIIDNCIVILNNKLKHKIEIIKAYSDDVVINGNEGQIHQMFTNILSNSEQAITDKGYIKITTKANDKKVFISIKDSGIGINKAQINRIFEPFYTTKQPGKGTGLGLSIVYNIIKEHKGNIDIKSKQNIGTNLEITFNKFNNGI